MQVDTELTRDELVSRASKLELILLDVDGVFTDGSIIYSGEETETKKFNVKDGMGITLARKAGLGVGIITGRVSDVVRRRAEELDIEWIFQGYFWKDEALREITEELETERDCMAFVGDDVLDTSVMSSVGLSFAPGDAHESARACSSIVLESPGGRGAIREAVDLLLELRGEKADLYRHFSRGAYEPETE